MTTRAEALAMLTPLNRKTVEETSYELGVFPDGTVAIKVECSRCGGSGHYSLCEMYGTRCFNCNVASGGKLIGFVWKNATKWATALRKNLKQAEKRAKEFEAKQAEWEKQREAQRIAEEQRLARIEAEKIEKQSKQEWLGTVGEKIEVVATVKFSKFFPAQNYGWSGRTLNSFVTDSGSVVIHWYTGRDELEAGSKWTVKGTVKEHAIYEKTGDKQTVLTRAKYNPATILGESNYVAR